MTDPRLIRLRVELFAAAQMLEGEDLAEFKRLIRDVAEMLEVLEAPIDSTQPTDEAR